MEPVSVKLVPSVNVPALMVKIEFADDVVRSYRFTGIFEKEELSTVLSFLKESKSFNYEIIPGETSIVKLYK